jgi:hypothetical protein
MSQENLGFGDYLLLAAGLTRPLSGERVGFPAVAGSAQREVPMHSRLRPSPAMVIALIALFVSLGGTAAALSGSNTVFTDDIANDTFSSGTEGPGGLVAADLRPSSVGSSEVLNDSLTGADTALGYSRPQASTPAPPNVNEVSPKERQVNCPAGSKVTGGGYVLGIPGDTGQEHLNVVRSYAVDADTWLVRAAETNDSQVGAWQLTVVANCLNG